MDRHCVFHRQKGPFPCGQSHWKGYSVVLLCMRGIWSPSLFSCSWTALWCRRSDFVSLEIQGERWSKASRAGPFFPWPTLLEGWKRLLSNTSSKKRIKVGGECGSDWESEGLMLRGGDEHGHMWRVSVCVCVCGGHTQAQTRGSVLDSHGLSGKDTVPLSLFLSHPLSSVWSSLMWTQCQHKGSLHLSLLVPFASLCEKGSFTGAFSLTPTYSNLSVTANWA